MKRLVVALFLGVLVLSSAPASAMAAGPSVSPDRVSKTTHTRAAACASKFGGSVRWDSGRIWGYGSTSTCKSTPWTKACVTVWKHYVPASSPKQHTCVSLKPYQSRLWRTPSIACTPGQVSVQVTVYVISKAVADRWTKHVDTTSGCPGSGKASVR